MDGCINGLETEGRKKGTKHDLKIEEPKESYD